MSFKENLVRYYAWLRYFGYNDSHSGNASIRIEDIIWVTPSGACADTLIADDLIECDITGTIGQNASYDARLHIEVYKRNPKAQAVLHSHGPHTIALTINGNDFTPEDFEGKLYFPIVPVHSIDFDKYADDSPEIVANCLSKYCITVVRGHGVYACAESLNLAYKWTCSLEHSANIAYLCSQISKS